MTLNDTCPSMMNSIDKFFVALPSQSYDRTFRSLLPVAANIERPGLSLFAFIFLLWKHMETPFKSIPTFEVPVFPPQTARHSLASSLFVLCLTSPVINPPWLFPKRSASSASAPLDWFMVISFVFHGIVVRPSKLPFSNRVLAPHTRTPSCPKPSEVISCHVNPYVARITSFSPIMATMMLLFSFITPTRSASLPSASSSSGEGERLDLGMHTSTTIKITIGCILILGTLCCLCLVARKRNFPSRSPIRHTLPLTLNPTLHRRNLQPPRTPQNDDEHEVYPGPPAYTRNDTHTHRIFSPGLVNTSTLPGPSHPVAQDVPRAPPPVYFQTVSS